MESCLMSTGEANFPLIAIDDGRNNGATATMNSEAPYAILRRLPLSPASQSVPRTCATLGLPIASKILVPHEKLNGAAGAAEE